MNYGPATYTGRISTVRRGPVHIARDGDAEFFLEPDGGGPVLSQPAGTKYHGLIGLEFSTAETIRWFRTPWWRRFPFRQVSYRPYASLLGNLRRHPGEIGPFPALERRPGSVIGLLGLDNAHDEHTELHPVYAVAVQTETAPERETWQVFARSWGTGGDCGGRLDHRLDSRRLALPLPSGAGPWASAQGRFLDHGLPFGDWKVYSGSSEPALVLDCRPIARAPSSRARSSCTASETEGLRCRRACRRFPSRFAGTPSRAGDQLCTKESWFVPVR